MAGLVLERLVQQVCSSDQPTIVLLSHQNDAECIAAFTKRPLMILTSSDIGTDPATVEKELTKHFKTAKGWDAVLLIDEADVFMERRSVADLTRNSLVAGEATSREYHSATY